LSGVPVTDGYIGQIGFKTVDGFDGETEIVLLVAAIGDATTFENIESEPKTSVVIRTGTGAGDGDGDGGQAGPSPDFDGDGTVGFRDFILFAQSYGKDPAEFVAPKSVLSKPSGHVETNQNAHLALIPQSGDNEDEVTLLVRLHEADEVVGFSMRLSFDSAAMEWTGVEGVAPSRFVAPGEVSVAKSEGTDKIVLSDILHTTSAIQGEGDLLKLYFRMLDNSQPGRVDVVQALIADGTGRLQSLLGAGSAVIRSMPREFALGINFPNPFNPETVLPFSLPEPADVKLVVFNVLGQQVRVLAHSRFEAGFHRIVWNGRDDRGREMASGLYLTRMVAGEYVGISKMLLIK
jgi:hypothetical protein